MLNPHTTALTRPRRGLRHDGVGSFVPGFAIIVTVSMLILLAVVAIGLLSLSTITVRAAGQSSAQEVARANARLALILAIGDLQKAAGPDQRVTATADIAGGAGGLALEAGKPPQNGVSIDRQEKGLSSVQPGTRYWTGVFSNADDPAKIYVKTPAPKIERWLVSGLPNPAAPALGILPSRESCVVGSDGTVRDPAVAAVLVGPNTVGTGADSLGKYVAVPIVPVKAGAGGGLMGAIAYWVGDEGVKARLNMERSNEDPDSYAALVAQRRGWETVPGFEAYPSPEGDADQVLPGIVTVPTAKLLLPALSGGSPTVEQTIFHSATAESRGLLVDTLDGGMRVDLTAALDVDLPGTAPPGAYDNYPLVGGRVIPVAVDPARGRNAPQPLPHLTWDHVRDFYKLHEKLSGDVLKVSSRSSAGEASIGPVVLDFRILMGVRFEPVTGRGIPEGKFKLHPCGKFAVAIANPYSVPLEWEDDLEFEVKNVTPPGNQPSRIWQHGACAYINRDGNLDAPGGEAAVFNQAVFRIKPGSLGPGEARAYTNAGRVVRPAATANRRQVVDLAPFGSASPFDFNNCVEMTVGTEVSLPQNLDVRESWQTTLVALEMRSGGSGRGRYNWMRRLVGFELDNGYFSPNTRKFNSSNTTTRVGGPVPLMLYSFQISQPGMDYKSLMPQGYELGQRSSAMRTFADFNVRASTVHKAITSYNPPPYFVESNDSEGQLGAISPGGDTGIGFTRNLALDPLYWGRSSVRGSAATVLFSVPRQFASLAQLQHADLTNDDESVSIGHQPGNAFGNSYACPLVRRDLVSQSRTDYVLMGSPNTSGAYTYLRYYYDISHILNTSLWDRYFFSTIPSGGSTPENPTLVTAPDSGAVDLRDPSQVGAGLMIDGAFNINSTDKTAWKVFLATAKYFEHKADSTAFPEATFPRSLEQPAGHRVPPTGEGKDSFAGYRRLTDVEIDDLATEIVKQVRLRGPFVSLSHFVNRTLAPFAGQNDAEQNGLTRSGALQFALDESGINISQDGTRNSFTGIKRAEEDRAVLLEKKNPRTGQTGPRADLDGDDDPGRPADQYPRHPDWATTSRDNNFGAVASIVADQEMLKKEGSPGRGDLSREMGYRSTGIPGWVTQADVLQVIGPSISARSDTFRIRALGEARDSTGQVVATAHCEAIVQRQPAYVDPADASHERPGDLVNTNKTFGRRFEMVSFRWLSPNDI